MADWDAATWAAVVSAFAALLMVAVAVAQWVSPRGPRSRRDD